MRTSAHILLGVLVAFAFPLITLALNTITTGFQVGASQITIDVHGVCQKVNSTDGKSYFVPTNTAAEWSAFRANKPVGVTLNACCAVPYSWSPAASMSVGRREHAAALLSDGKTLVCGGTSSTIYNRCDTYDVSTDSWSPVASLPEAKYGLSMVTLTNGKILACGGYNGSISKRCDTYDQNTNTWTRVADMPLTRANFGMAILGNNNVLACGGQVALNGSTYTTQCDVYSPANNTWTLGAHMSVERSAFPMAATTNGEALACGGSLESTQCERYNPSTNSWTSASQLNRERLFSSAALLQNGSVFICGRFNWWSPSCELYDTATNAVSTTTPPNVWDSMGPTVSPLSDGRALYCGGTVSTHESACYIFDPGIPGVQCGGQGT